MTHMTNLLARLQAATQGSAELDAAVLRLAWVKTDFHSWLREEQNDGTYLVVGHVYCGIVMIWRGRIMLGSEAEGIGPFPTRAEAEDAVERAVIERMGGGGDE